MLSNGGRIRVALLVSSLNLTQSAFLKFHLTGLLELEATSGTGVMSDGRCWDLGNSSSTRRVGDGWSSVLLAKARFVFVSAFQQAEWKLSDSFGLYRRVRLLADAHCTRQGPSLLDLEWPLSVWCQLKSPPYMQGWLTTGNDALVRRVGGGLYTLMMVTSWTFIASHSNWESSSDCASKDHSMSCLTKVARPCCLFKMCAARVNYGIVSFSVVSQCVSCNNMAVTLLVYASCSMIVRLALVRPSTFNCSIVDHRLRRQQPSALKRALSRALGHKFESPS